MARPRFQKFFGLLLGILVGLVAPGAPASLFTPLSLEVLAPPVPVQGSDGAFHLVYELRMTNATSRSWSVESLEVLAEGKKRPLAQWSGEALKNKIGLLGTRAATLTLEPSQTAVAWIPLRFAKKSKIPVELRHRLNLRSGPVKTEEIGGSIQVAKDKPPVLHPPLRGDRWVAADGCCQSTRHVRALLPIGTKLFTAQRFAIDWEKLGPKDTLFEGDAKKVENYFCYGQKVYAVADGKVVLARDGLSNQVPGKLPEGLPPEQADGNHVVQEIAPGKFALYAHLKPGSLQVKTGDPVKRGQVLGLVGNSGNTSEPHLHFHVMDGPSPLGSNGLPYVFTGFDLLGKTPGTEAFDRAALQGTVLKILPVKKPGIHQDQLPLDQRVVNFLKDNK